MFTHYRSEALFLKKEDRGEADRLFTVFTKEFGKIEVLGRGIRKIKSKLRAGADIFYFSEIEFIQGKTYKTLTDAVLKNRFPRLMSDERKMALGGELAEMVVELSSFEEKDEKLWGLILDSFREIDKIKVGLSVGESKESGLEFLYLFFAWNFFSLLGYRPELYYCAVCGRKLLPETFWFVPSEGGVVCWRCFNSLKKSWQEGAEEKHNFSKMAAEIGVDSVKVARFFLEKGLKESKKVKLTERIKKELKATVQLYYDYLKSGVFNKEKIGYNSE
jgi:DNA repair protein RecO (recombination protein O)